MERTLYDWAAAAADALELPEDARWLADRDAVREVLDLARDLAHGVTRPAAPVGAFLAGVAIGLRAHAEPDAVARVRATMPLAAPDEPAIGLQRAAAIGGSGAAGDTGPAAPA